MTHVILATHTHTQMHTQKKNMHSGKVGVRVMLGWTMELCYFGGDAESGSNGRFDAYKVGRHDAGSSYQQGPPHTYNARNFIVQSLSEARGECTYKPPIISTVIMCLTCT